MERLIHFCLRATEEDLFKYLMLSAAQHQQSEQIQNLLNKYNETTNSKTQGW